MHLWNRIATRWSQYYDETTGFVRGFQLLIVNLALIGKVKPVKTGTITVIVDSWHEAVILWLLWIAKVLPRYQLMVVRCARDLNLSAESDFRGELVLIATSRAFTKHYQLLADLRHQRRLIVL
jgi:hypothetical protein